MASLSLRYDPDSVLDVSCCFPAMQQQFLAASGSFDLALEVGADWYWPFTKPDQWQW
jgi:hypothetical protein